MGFETLRLVIRPWTLEDADAALRMYGDPAVMRYLGRNGAGATIQTLEEMRERLGRSIAKYPPDQDYLYSAVELKDSMEPIGTALLKPLELSDGTAAIDEIEIGWHLARKHWGKGYGTELGMALAHHGLTTLGLPELHAIAYPENIASIRIMQKIGMQYLGSTDRYYGVVAEHYVIRG